MARIPDTETNFIGEGLWLKPGDKIAKRPAWRHPSGTDFFELQPEIVRLDWPNREIDRLAKRADGFCIYVGQPMTRWERVTLYPFVRAVKFYFAGLFCRRNSNGI